MSDRPEPQGHFEEDGRYVSANNPPKNPVWTPEKPDTGWSCNPEEDKKTATFTHPRHPIVVFVWDERMDILSGIIVWQSKPYQIQTKRRSRTLQRVYDCYAPTCSNSIQQVQP